MMSFTREWLVAEARRQGLFLDDADIEAIYERAAMTKAELERSRPDGVESLEPVYRFVSPDETAVDRG
ncbi:MAG TPA: hypothetical protein VFL28_09355 [bacterium]|nr:hypothetical protein [bacterium]